MQFRPSRSEADEPRIDITPLIDVVFQLLIFFMLTTTFVTHPTIKVDLPKASEKAQPQKNPDEIVVALTRDGRIVYDGHAVDTSSLESVFRKAAGQKPDTTVMLQADREVTHGRVVQVMDLARRAGLRKLAIATQAEQGAP